jgi:hypothetical protein
MINNLKIAIRKKNLYFRVKDSVKNIRALNILLIKNIISGFTKSSQKKRSSLIAYVNYCSDFNSSITGVTKYTSKVSNQQNKVQDAFFCKSNFIMNNQSLKKEKDVKRSNIFVKFR